MGNKRYPNEESPSIFNISVITRGFFRLQDRTEVAFLPATNQTLAFTLFFYTGDNEAEGQRIGRSLGIIHVEAGLTPQGKLDAIASSRERRMSHAGKPGGVIMVRCPSPNLSGTESSPFTLTDCDLRIVMLPSFSFRLRVKWHGRCETSGGNFVH